MTGEPRWVWTLRALAGVAVAAWVANTLAWLRYRQVKARAEAAAPPGVCQPIGRRR